MMIMKKTYCFAVFLMLSSIAIGISAEVEAGEQREIKLPGLDGQITILPGGEISVGSTRSLIISFPTASYVRCRKQDLDKYEDYCRDVPPIETLKQNCDEIRLAGARKSGIYYIKLDSMTAIQVWCDIEETIGWTVIQRRMNGRLNFLRGWDDYKQGFGHLPEEHWLGLDNIHILTKTMRKLRITLKSCENEVRTATYNFAIASESDNYRLSVSGYVGNAEDSLSGHNGLPFSTFDQDNDSWNQNCANVYRGAWWYGACHTSNLNGQYYPNCTTTDFATGAVWLNYKGYHYSMKRVVMAIAP